MARVLVVDDDPDILKVADRVLTAVGHDVAVAPDAIAAMSRLDRESFDLLISDANMPHYSGFELVQTVRREDRFRDMAVAMLTGRADRRDVERAIEAGIDEYIVKPLDPLLLVQKVTALFTKRPPVEYPEIITSGAHARGTLRWPVTVTAVSELGVRITTELSLKRGQVIEIGAEFFRTLEVEPPPLKVLSVDPDVTPGLYQVSLTYLGAREAFLQRIRRWMYSRRGTAGAKAA